MSHENELQRRIMAAIGAEKGLILMKNSVGVARYTSPQGREYTVPYGLGVGSPDLVGILDGRWFCLEVKAPGGRLTSGQSRIGDLWREYGAIVEVVRTAEEARNALERARNEHY